MTKRTPPKPKRNDAPRSFRFQPDEIALLDRMAALHGGAKGAVVAGLMALETGGQVTKAAVLQWIKDNAG